MRERKRVRIGFVFMVSLLFASFSLYAQTADEALVKAKISKASGRIGIPAINVQDALITKTYTDKSSGIQYVYLQQTRQGIPIYNSIKTLAFKGDALVYSSGAWLQKTERFSRDTTARIEAAEAIRRAVAHLKLPNGSNLLSLIRTEISGNKKKWIFPAGKLAKRDIEVQLYWAPDSLQQLHLAWNVNIDVANSPDWWNVRVDAKNGDIVSKDNWTTYEQSPHKNDPEQHSSSNHHSPENYLAPPNDASSASYYVIPFPAENQNVLPFTTVTNPWEMAGANNNATTYGWHYNGTATYNISRGNNVYAYDDSTSKNAPGSVATSVTPLPALSFPFVPDFTQTTSLSVNKSAAITNLFYWNNLMHDVMYQYGFDEASGNFQASNLSRGGKENDPVMAEAHDGSGLNNANFASPDDGTSGRMQMYLWNAAKPPSFVVNTPPAIAGSYNSTESGFSVNNKLIKVGPVSDTLALYTTDTLACSSVLPTNIKGKIALMYRGTCNFTVKVLNAQKAGATAVVMINTAGSDLITMGGSNDTITIPAIMVSYTDGSTIANSIKAGNTVTATLTGAPLIDGDFDNGVMCHEYGHGVTHRLTGGNASCMSNNERPDEGWSDYFGLMMTQDWTHTALSDSAKSRPFGNYVFGEGVTGSGIRTYPYSTNFTVDPHTYTDIATNGEVHYIGEVWCSALWDMTWNIIKQEQNITSNIYDANGSGGNAIALRLVIEGEKLQPCSPGFLDARNAILAADSILFNNRHKCVIWSAFARRGMGFSAVQGSSDKTDDQTVAFDVPVLRLHTDSVPAINDLFTTKITISCECQLPPAGYKLIDTLPSAFTVLSTGPTATVQNGLATWDASNFTALGQSNTYSITLRPDSTAGCTKDTILFDDRDAHTGGGFASSAARSTAAWTSNTTQAYSPTHAWYAPDPETPSDFSLTSDAFTPSGFSILSFHHRFTTEAGYDGGMIDISTTNGTTWTGSAPYFIRNGYNGVIYQYIPADTSYGTTPMPSFTGALKDSGFITSYINLSAFAGKPVKIRFRMYTDLGTTYEGWYVDDISVTNGCGGLQNIGLYNNAGKIISGLKTGTFNIDSNGVVLPAFGDFTAVAVNNISSLLNWTTVSISGVASFVVEHSTDSVSFTLLTTVSAQSVGSAYTFTDNSPVTGNNYYRIRMTDANGNTLVTSPVRKVVFTRNSGGIAIIPNPAVSSATVLIDASLNATAIVVYDMVGRRVLASALSSGATSYRVNTSALATGIYVVQVIPATGDAKQVKMMVRR